MIGPMTALAALLVLPQGDVQAHVVTAQVSVAAADTAERAPALRDSLASLDYGSIEVAPKGQASAPQADSGKTPRSTSSKVMGGVLGAAVGFVAGRYFGQAIGGLGGYIVGGPVGAIAGGILGAKF